MKKSLNSIVGALKHGVIVCNDCTDGSEEIILDFCSKHKGFIAMSYPHSVLPNHHTQIERQNLEKRITFLH